MNTKKIGNIGEAKVLSKLIELGIPVYLPFGDNERADLIAEFNKKLNKIQVKTSIKAKDGKILFDLTSSTEHRKKGCKYKYTNNDIDYFFCYNIERDNIYIVSVKEELRGSIVIRYEDCTNSQNKHVNFEKDFLLENNLSLFA